MDTINLSTPLIFEKRVYQKSFDSPLLICPYSTIIVKRT